MTLKSVTVISTLLAEWLILKFEEIFHQKFKLESVGSVGIVKKTKKMIFLANPTLIQKLI